MQEPEHLTTSQVAAALGVDVRTIHRWVTSGRIAPSLKLAGIRGPYLFAQAEVERVKQSTHGASGRSA